MGAAICTLVLYSEASAKEAYKRVARWTKKVDIFSKDVVFVPINEQYVYSLLSLIMSVGTFVCGKQIVGSLIRCT